MNKEFFSKENIEPIPRTAPLLVELFKKDKEIIKLKEKIKTDIDLLKNYEFDKYDWNYMEQQAVAEYLEKEILKGSDKDVN